MRSGGGGFAAILSFGASRRTFPVEPSDPREPVEPLKTQKECNGPFPLHSYYIIYLKAMASFRVESQLAILGIHMEDFLLFESLLQNELGDRVFDFFLDGAA